MSFLLPLFVIHLLALMTPGPDFLIVSKTAMAYSRRAAMSTAFGVSVGVAAWVALVLTGLHVLFDQFSWMQTAIKVGGGIYLLYLGVQMLRAAFQRTDLSAPLSAPLAAESAPDASLLAEASLSAAGDKRDSAAFFSGLVTNLSNPKVIVYFGSIFATFLTHTVSIADKITVFALVTIESLLWFLLVALLFSLPLPRRAYQRAHRWIDGIAGVAFSGFGLRLIFTSGH